MTQINDKPDLVSSKLTSNILVQDSSTGTTNRLAIRRDGYEDLKPTEWLLPGGAANPSIVNTLGVHELIEYSGTVNERRTCLFHPPHDFVEGSDIFFHIHHLPTAASPAGVVDWRVHYQFAQGYQNGFFTGIDLTQDISVDLSASSAVQYEHFITEGLAINDATVGSVIRTDGVFIATLERLGSSDTNNANQIFLEFDMHYLSDGTKTVNRNDTGTGFTKV